VFSPIGLDGGFRMERAVIEAVDQSSSTRRVIHESGDLPMHSIHIVFAVATSGNAALIGDHDQAISSISKPAEAIRHAVEEHDSRRITKIAIIGDQRVISIKKDHRIHEP
jgi:hypothetical protein